MIDFTVSVIIPAYNSARTIELTLMSIYRQTCKNLIKEVIVVNDGSTDNTAELVEKFANIHKEFPLKLLNKENGGVSSARNLGMEHATGLWIALCDSDDEWFINKLEIQYKVIQSNSNIDFLGGNHTNKTINIWGYKINKLYSPSIKELCIKMFPQTSTVIFKRDIFDDIGGFDESRYYGEDGNYFMKICDRYGYYYHPEQVVEYDGGRRGFGVSGLSGNLREMQNGQRMNIKDLYLEDKIGVTYYIFVRIYIEVKYIRRLLICKVKQ